MPFKHFHIPNNRVFFNITKKIIHKDLLYSTGNYIQYYVITYMENNLKKCIYSHIYL